MLVAEDSCAVFVVSKLLFDRLTATFACDSIQALVWDLKKSMDEDRIGGKPWSEKTPTEGVESGEIGRSSWANLFESFPGLIDRAIVGPTTCLR